MNERFNIAQSQATFMYPAVTQDELDNDSLLLTNYRRSLGRERLLWIGLAVLAGAWTVSYLRAGK